LQGDLGIHPLAAGKLGQRAAALRSPDLLRHSIRRRYLP
jgi:hypothetical protein